MNLFIGRWLFVFLLLGGATVQAETVKLVADPWCPFNCEPGDDAPGYMIEIAQRVFAEHGIEVEYHTLPWVRALMAVEAGEYSAAVGASRAEAPNFVFPELPQGLMNNVFWTLADSDWVYQGQASLKQINLAIIAGYGYSPELEAYIRLGLDSQRVTELFGETPLQNGILMLERGRIDALLEEQSVFQYQLMHHGRSETFRNAGGVAQEALFSEVYIAFSPELEGAEHYADILTEGMAQLRQSGELNKILSRYGVTDWAVETPE
ncbi:MAG: transporter substrate-binding domain-containing protein [Saccharospirillum sp.]|nr:transporter substrate-binding domain-containing protein [Saccharospirillum sp.]